MIEYDKCTAASWFNDNRQEFWIYRTKCRIPTGFWHANIIIALLSFRRLSVHMTKFWTSYNAKWHFFCVYLFFLGRVCCFVSNTLVLSFLRKRAHTFKKKVYVRDDCCYFSTSDTGGRRRRPTTPLMWFGVNVGKKMHSMNNTMKMGKLY